MRVQVEQAVSQLAADGVVLAVQSGLHALASVPRASPADPSRRSRGDDRALLE